MPFPVWVQDILLSQDYRLMGSPNRGGYCTLMFECWADSHCSLPSDDEQLRSLSLMTEEEWRAAGRVRERFIDHPEVPGRLTHPIVWEKWVEAREYRDRCSEAGRRGNDVRWGGESGGDREANRVANRVAIARQSPPSPSPSPSPSPEEKELSPESIVAAGNLRDAIVAWKPNHKVASRFPDSTLHGWARDLDLLHRRDGVEWERIWSIIAWLPTSEFWAPNIQSGAKLRKHFDRLEAERSKRPAARLGVLTGKVATTAEQDAEAARQLGIKVF